jgi:hypothetical protein
MYPATTKPLNIAPANMTNHIQKFAQPADM